MKRRNFQALTLLWGLFPIAAASFELNPDIGVVLDGHYTSARSALSESDKGFGLGHTELSLSSPIDDLFEGRLTAVLEEHDGHTDTLLEEAYLQTTALPLGLGIRAGRFLSQVGYLNSRHMHEDDFVQRPAAYRALLGSHYYDDGVRVNLLIPTPFYWSFGAELFDGGQLSEEDSAHTVGVWTFRTRLGGDISSSQSWQAGFSWLRNRNAGELSHGHDHDHDHGDHDHFHGAGYTGKNLYLTELVWKWAPGGNNRQRQLALSAEHLFADRLNSHARSGDSHEAWYASAVYRFAPQWSAGLRYGRADLLEAHGDHFHDQRLKETEVMLSWQHSHFSTLRLQYTHQEGFGLDDIDHTVTLQYLMTFGAHGAHDF